ncbi:hypothetical protein EX30DRAFT_355605 [Ascodesmis nigricans]|uniref:Integral membrane protein n=1 Tax=Ascodesmis nigricans TaxID=341454 RepID=A0A4S2MTH7_9PEZI|nr:hypothetical protein EX30DRAFT_355605 [Ascodesmis nigricans]
MTATLQRGGRRGRRIHPIVKAYLVGWLSHFTPRLLAWVVAVVRRKKKCNKESLNELFTAFKKSLDPHRFPFFCGATIAGAYVLRPLIILLFRVATGPINSAASRAGAHSDARSVRSLRGLAALRDLFAFSVAAGIGLRGLNRRKGRAGRTLDLTLLAVVRAIDVVVGELWHQHRVARKRAGAASAFDNWVGWVIDPAVFAVTSGMVMFAWFYAPEKLPPSYNRQLSMLANVDERLIMGLRKIREGEWVYGKETGLAHLFGGLAADNGLPFSWGDPAKTMPIPCEVIHSAETPSCEIHSLRRLILGTTHTTFPLYLTLNLLRFLRPSASRTPRALLLATLSAARSASFLGTFIALFWYGVCLTRTRLGPLIVNLAPESWGWGQLNLERTCVHTGCMLAGWSILLEKRQRRPEFAFFVAPRAAATVLPRKYDRKNLWIEQLVFGISVGIVFSTVKHNPKRVRGVFGKLLQKVLN